MNFMIKKLALIVILIIGVVVFSGCVGKKTGAPLSSGEVENGKVENGEEVEETEEPLELTGRMDEDKCVELMAYYMYWSQLALVKHDVIAASPIMDKIEGLYAKYGVTQDDYDEVCNAMLTPEFLERVGARMKELGFVEE